MRIYHPGESWNPGEFASLLAIGDSWFWYPRNNLLQALIEHPRLKEDFKNIQMLGYNGAKLEEYVSGRYAKQLEYELHASNRAYYSAILISGAGNDAVDYRLGLFQDCSKASAVDQCINDGSMSALLGSLSASLGALLEQIHQAFAEDGRQPDIFLHSYDYPHPDGRGFIVPGLQVTGPWLASAMDDCHVPADQDLRQAICHVLIDRLHREFVRFASAEKNIYLINSRGCLVSPDYRMDWDNELHPTRQGFAQIVDQRWIPVLLNRGYAR